MPLTAVLAGGSVVDLDATVLIQLGAFLLLFLLLRPLLFRPLLAVLVEREKATEGDVKEAGRRQTEAEEKMRKYEKELDRIRGKASVEREKIRESGREREREILSKATDDVTQVIDEGRDQMAKEADKTRADMDKEIDVLSKSIVSVVLGREKAA